MNFLRLHCTCILIFFAFPIFLRFLIMKTIFRFIFKQRDDFVQSWHRNFSEKCWTKQKTSVLRVLGHHGAHQTFSNYRELLRNVFRKESLSRQIRNLFGEFRSKLSLAFDYQDAKNSQQISEEFDDLQKFSQNTFYECCDPLEALSLARKKNLEIENEKLWLLLAPRRSPERRV